MKSMRFGRTRMFSMALVGVALLGTIAVAQQTWWVQSADYGAGNRRQDVTNTVRRLVNGPNFKVNNSNMGVDPAVGADKTLRIVAKDPGGKVRDFYYKEGQTVNAQMFTGGPQSGKPGWPGWGGPGGGGQVLRITSAKWGLGSRQQDVTSRLQSMVRNNRLSVEVRPQTMGGDPAPGVGKNVTVFYNYGSRNLNKVVGEGAMLTLP